MAMPKPASPTETTDLELAAKNKIRETCLPESLHVLGRDPVIYVLIKHFF
jgi:hypothetical protein